MQHMLVTYSLLWSASHSVVWNHGSWTIRTIILNENIVSQIFTFTKKWFQHSQILLSQQGPCRISGIRGCRRTAVGRSLIAPEDNKQCLAEWRRFKFDLVNCTGISFWLRLRLCLEYRIKSWSFVYLDHRNMFAGIVSPLLSSTVPFIVWSGRGLLLCPSQMLGRSRVFLQWKE